MMKLKKLSITSIMCVICAVFLLGTAITVFVHAEASENVSVGAFYEVSEDEENSDSEFSVGAFEVVFDEEDNEDSVGAFTDENDEAVSTGIMETIDEE